MQRQNSLGSPKVHRTPTYEKTKIGKVVSVANYKKYGKIDVVFLDYGATTNVWVLGDVDREPIEGDMVIVGYMEGRKDTPYMAGFVRNQSYTSNRILIGKDYVRVQLPASDKDREGNLLDDTKKEQRPYVELTSTKTRVFRPSGVVEVVAPTLKLTGTTKVEVVAPAISLSGNITMTGSSITANGENLSIDNT
jgi:hypothetical protein